MSIKSKHHSSIWLFANVYGLNWENVRKRKQIIWHNMLWYGSCTCSLHSQTYVWCRPKHSVFHVSAATCTELCFWDESKSNEKKRQQERQIRRTNEKIENPAKHRYQHLTDYIFLVSLSFFLLPYISICHTISMVVVNTRRQCNTKWGCNENTKQHKKLFVTWTYSGLVNM